jgi:hypothetical protein
MLREALTSFAGAILLLSCLVGCSMKPATEPEAQIAMKNGPLLKITKEAVEKLVLDDLQGGEMVLFRNCCKVRDEQPGGSLEEKELAMLTRIPEKLGHYYLIFRFDGLWGNGGMQAVALDHDASLNSEILQRTVEAHRAYGNEETAALIEKLIPVASAAAMVLNNSEERDIPDAEMESIWATIDAFDAPYEQAGEGGNIYEAMLKDMHQNPQQYVP